MSVAVACRILVASLFILAAVGKVFNLRLFAKAVSKFGFLTGWPAWWLACGIALTELALGLWMLISPRSDLNLYGAICLFSIFALVVGLNLLAHNAGECGCLPFVRTLQATWRLVFRNAALSILAWLGTSPRSVGSMASAVFALSMLVVIFTVVADSMPLEKSVPKSEPGLKLAKDAAA